MHKKILLALLTTVFFITSLTGCSQITSMRVSKQLKLANKYLMSADYEEAILSLQKVIQIDPKNVDAHILLADAFSKVGRVTEAEETLKKAQQINGVTKDKLAEIDEKLDSLNYIVGFSASSGNFSDPVIITLSNAKNYNITYTLETDNQRLSATDVSYTSPIILDDDGDYKLSSYCTDDSGTKHEVSVATYSIKLDKDKYPNNSWELNNGIYRYRDSTGQIATDWQQIDGVWYYLKENGDMSTGWIQIDGVWYHFGDDGVMTVNSSVDGYTLASDGTISGVDINNSSSRNIFGVFDNKMTTMFSIADMRAVSNTTQGVIEALKVENSQYILNYYKYDKKSHTFPDVIASSSFDTEFEGQFELRRLRSELGLTFSSQTLHETLTLENIDLVFE